MCVQVVCYKGCLKIFISNARNRQVIVGLACCIAAIVFLVHFSLNLEGTLSLLALVSFSINFCFIWISSSFFMWSLIDYIFTEVVQTENNWLMVNFSVYERGER